MRVAEVHAHAGGLGQITMHRQLFAAVVGQRLSHRCGDLVELDGEGRQRRFGLGIGHIGQQHQAGRALHQNAYGGLVTDALDQIAFPVARRHAIGDLRRGLR